MALRRYLVFVAVDGLGHFANDSDVVHLRGSATFIVYGPASPW